MAAFRRAFPPPEGAHVFVAVYDRIEEERPLGVVAEVWSTTNPSSNPLVRGGRIASRKAEVPYEGPTHRENGSHSIRPEHEKALGELLRALTET